MFVCWPGCLGPDLSLCAFVWEAQDSRPGGTTQVFYSIFDMNRWYHAQMPSRIKWVVVLWFLHSHCQPVVLSLASQCHSLILIRTLLSLVSFHIIFLACLFHWNQDRRLSQEHEFETVKSWGLIIWVTKNNHGYKNSVKVVMCCYRCVNVGGQEVCPYFAVYHMDQAVLREGCGSLLVSMCCMIYLTNITTFTACKTKHLNLL